ncbi:glycosyltransferase [Oceaniradius stylonematis]|uniref:glycosyltransferase n=1 Tax=Oceaniradius stylonematis TaxID=2184161 RepID=UPI003C7DA7C3
MAEPLKIWLVQTGEEMPDDPGPPRLLRTALLARQLTERGHEIVFWNATFNHQQKVQRFDKSTVQQSRDGYTIQYLAGRPYSRNISGERILSQMTNAREFARIAPGLPRPDVILCGLPTLELCAAVADFAVPRGVPFALDCRDLWPDIFEDHLTGVKALAGWPAMAWWRRLKRSALSRATAVTGVTSAFVEWGVSAAGRPAGPLDRAFHLAVPGAQPSSEAMQQADSGWDELIGPRDDDMVVACYPGTFSRRLDIPAFIEGLSRVDEPTRKQFRMVICGKGDLEDHIRSRTARMEHAHFAGWRGAADLKALMNRSTFGVLPYARTPDFRRHFVNKVGEYLAAGLPIMTGLDGLTGDLLERTGLGIPYEVGNPESVARAIETAVADKEQLRSLKDDARDVYMDMFDPDVIYGQFCDYLEELAAIRPGQDGAVAGAHTVGEKHLGDRVHGLSHCKPSAHLGRERLQTGPSAVFDRNSTRKSLGSSRTDLRRTASAISLNSCGVVPADDTSLCT